jgi:hypothetical protein
MQLVQAKVPAKAQRLDNPGIQNAKLKLAANCQK